MVFGVLKIGIDFVGVYGIQLFGNYPNFCTQLVGFIDNHCIILRAVANSAIRITQHVPVRIENHIHMFCDILSLHLCYRPVVGIGD